MGTTGRTMTACAVLLVAFLATGCSGDGPGPTPSTDAPFTFEPIACESPAGPTLGPGQTPASGQPAGPVVEPPLAFVGYEPGSVQPDVYLAEPDGTEVRTLLSASAGPVRSMAWSPDGRTLAVAAGGVARVVGVDGTDAAILVDRPTVVSQVAWSPTGEWVAFAAGEDGNTFDFQRYTAYLIRPDGSELHPLSELPTDGSRLTWSPDGRWVAFAAYFGQRLDLAAVPVDGGQARRLTRAVQYATSPDWAPDCTEIAFVSGQVGGDDIHSLVLDGSGERKLTRTPITDPASVARDPVWSPDSRLVAFYIELPDPSDIPNPELFVVERDGSPLTILTEGDGGVDDGLTWSSDGRRIFYGLLTDPPPGRPLRPDGTGWSLWSVTADGAIRAEVELPEQVEDPHLPALATHA